MRQITMNSNGTGRPAQSNIMLAFQEKAQQIAREHTEMLELIYKNTAVENQKMLFEQHYIFLKDELVDLLLTLIKEANNKAEHNIAQKLTETLDNYLISFQKKCAPETYKSR